MTDYGSLDVTIVEAKNLPNFDTGLLHTSDDKTDAYVVVSCPGISKSTAQKTKVVLDNLDPKWNETFKFTLCTIIENNINANLLLRVWDQDGVKDDEVGWYTLNLQQVAMSKVFDDWVVITDTSNKDTGAKLRVRIKYTPSKAAAGAGAAAASLIGGAVSAMIAETVTVPIMGGGGGPKPVPKGEWVVRLTIHEGRGLQAEDAVCLDPVVKISAGGVKRTTSVVKNTLNPNFDEDFTMTFTGNNAETFWDKTIVLEVFHNKVFVDARIGAFSFDFSSIYDQPGHEYNRRWVVLQKGDGDVAVMGYLLVSVAVLGPQDDLVPHDEVLTESDTLSNCLYPKNTPFQTISLDITVYRAEDVPQMDFSFTTGINAIDKFTGQKDKQNADPFVNVSYGGRSVQTITVPQSQYPEFYQTVQLPMIIPSMSREVRVRLIDYDAVGENDVIATACLDMETLTANGTRMPRMDPTWFNLYGAPRAFALTPPIEHMKYYERMNNGLVPGNTYRGRVLISIEGRLNSKSSGSTTMQRVPYESPPMPIANCILTVEMMWGCMLPSGKLRVIASWGDNNAATQMIKAKVPYDQPQVTYPNRSVDWNERLELRAAWELQGIPDLTLTLMDDSERMSYVRFEVASLLGKAPAEKTLFLVPNIDPEDAEDTVVGMLGCRIGLSNEAPQSLQKRLPPNPPPKRGDAPMTKGSPMTVLGAKQMTVRAHIFKARCLPAGDDCGLTDPYIRVVFGSGCGQTTFLCNTLNPNINELVVFESDVFQPFPLLVVEAWDRDLIGKDTYLGRFMMPLKMTKGVPPLQWFKLDKGGEVLASFELVVRGSAVSPPGAMTTRTRVNPPPFVNSTFQAIPVDKSIAPIMYKAVVDIDLLGLRNMSSYMMLDIKDSIVEFSIDEVSMCSKRVRGINPNFLEKITLNVDLPEDSSFVPDLAVKVFDHRFFGQRVLVGTTSFNLQQLIDPSRGIDFSAPEENDENEDFAHLKCPKDFDEAIVSKDAIMVASISQPTSPAQVHVQASYGTLGGPPGLFAPDEDEDDTISKWLKLYFKGQIPRYPNTVEKQFGIGGGGFNDRYPASALMRGVKSKTIGTWKGCVDVRRTCEPPQSGPKSSILKETAVLVRVYVLRASSLIPHDGAVTGGKNDPFLKLMVGSGLSSGGKPTQTVTTEDRVVYGTLNPEFMESFEFEVSMPSVNELVIAVWDYDTFGSNELIGSTLIDLEDRWFALNRDLIPAERHTERRNLYHKEQSGGTSQGRIEMWVDIIDKSKTPIPPRIDIHLPANEAFELRAIVYNVANCKLVDEASMTGEIMTDIYVKCFLEGKPEEAQDTDVHYRSMDGSGAFNWRMKFPLMYVRRDKGILLDMEDPKIFKLFATRKNQKPVKPNLIVQLWDNDCISANDFIGELRVPLDKRRAENQVNNGKFIPDTALNMTPLNLFGMTGPMGRQTINGLQPTQKIWYTIPGKDGKSVGEVQIAFQLVPTASAATPELEAGKGREEPNKNPMLPEPERPASSFFFLTSPLKTMYYIIWKNYKYYIVIVCCLLFLALLLYGFGVYSVQVGTYKMWGYGGPPSA